MDGEARMSIPPVVACVDRLSVRGSFGLCVAAHLDSISYSHVVMRTHLARSVMMIRRLPDAMGGHPVLTPLARAGRSGHRMLWRHGSTPFGIVAV